MAAETIPYGSLFLYMLLLLLPILIPFFVREKLFARKRKTQSSKLPLSYPILGAVPGILNKIHIFCQWTAEIVLSTSPSFTTTLDLPMGHAMVITANPSVVEHMLKTNFQVYERGEFPKSVLRDFLGNGIFNVDGEKWKLQRQLASREFNMKSLRKFLHSVINVELSDRLIPVLKLASDKSNVVDFQEILQRFGFDNICKISFGYDPEYLSLTPSSLQNDEFAAAFETATRISAERFNYIIPYSWKIKRALNLGSEKELKIALSIVQDLARKIIRRKKLLIQEKSTIDDGNDLLTRYLSSGFSDENLAMDMVISFILAGQDTTSTALTWFFWLLSKNPRVENNIVQEIFLQVSESESTAYDEVKQLVYTHAAICESMRLFPPVPVDSRIAARDDILPDGTIVKKGWILAFNAYAMGRMKTLWGEDWAEFRPERWLEKTADGEKWSFVNRDAYTYPIFLAGPRVCLGKEMAFIQMKSVISGVLQHFRVVPAVAGDTEEPNFLQYFTAKMVGGFPVRIHPRGK